VCSSNINPDTVRVNIQKIEHQMELKENVLEGGLEKTGYDEDIDDSTEENKGCNIKNANGQTLLSQPNHNLNLTQLQPELRVDKVISWTTTHPTT
jgi:hypothetical protein